MLRRLRLVGVSILTLTLLVESGWAQTTFSSLVGAVRDPSGAVVPGAKITVINVGTGERRTTKTDTNGNYEVLNLMPGGYQIRLEAPGFASEEVTDIQLLTQQTVRVDRSLRVGSANEKIEVSAAVEAPIATEVSHIAETKTEQELLDLPVAIASRASGSTSAFTTLTTQPEVEIDNSNNISVAGLRPAQVAASIDGLSTVSPYEMGPSAELFPSFEGISEIHVNEVNNSAEYGSVADVTTISKSGTNTLHGSLYDYFQNDYFDARNYFSSKVTPLHMNDFGASLGGPVVKNRTFFFIDYEGLRKPGATVLVKSVPSLALRSGDLSAYSTPITNPFTGQPFLNNQIPQSMISPFAQRTLQYLFPLPNTGGPNSLVNNYVDNFPTPISTNQGDVRVDQNIGTRHSVFARLTYKHVDQVDAPGTYYSDATPLIGPISFTYKYLNLAGGWNFIISSNVINELRGGWTNTPYQYTFPMPAGTIANQIGLTSFLPQAPPDYDLVPNFNISGFDETGNVHQYASHSGVSEGVDNLSIMHHNHTYKFGVQFQHFGASYFSNDGYARLGEYTYNGSSAVGSTIGNPFAEFLLGTPDFTEVSSVLKDGVDSYSNLWAFYGLDSWKVTPSLTLNYGLRWEYQPIMQDYAGNVGNFYGNTSTVVNGQTVNGALVIPDDRALKYLNPLLLASIAPTPLYTAAQLGLPSDMRFNPKTDFAPRFGFAWRMTRDSKNVLRGGFGVYYETLYSNVVNEMLDAESSYIAGFNNAFASNGLPQLAFPSSSLPNARPFPSNLAIPGSVIFCAAFDWNYKDPRVDQWNLTYERDLGFQTGLRLTYDGSHGSALGAAENANQVPLNTSGFGTPGVQEPYPLWSAINVYATPGRSNYNAFTIDLNKRFSHGLQFEASYNHAVNLSNAEGGTSTSFQFEGGGQVTNIYDVNYDYGNVSFTRRQRFQTTFIYNLPFSYKSNALLDHVVSGWEVAGVLLFQTGPFLSVQAAGADPGGDNFENFYTDPRADIVPGVPKYPAHQTVNAWVNPAAFAIPANNIGRMGDSQVGSVVGPGTQAVSLSLFKTFPIYERAKLKIGAQVANAFNHPNFAPPALDLGLDTFGTISGMQSADASGPRAMQISARITF
ncbi:MAG TPA: carboxypeptidase-like regulatory domain-containing protein [Terriglobales bacterium]|nr:carboxypeptidase-like regulatory domain-containing protein [Terriglobales bacterium]